MYMKMSSGNFQKLANYLRVVENFESVVVNVGDGTGNKKAGLSCIGMGEDSQVIMGADFDKLFFDEIVGEQAFVWYSEKMQRYAAFMKNEKNVMLTINKENILLESFDKDDNRVEAIMMAAKPVDAAKNYLEALPGGDLVPAKDTKYPDVERINLKVGRFDVRLKVNSDALQRITKRALEFNKHRYPISFKEGKLNIQSGEHEDRGIDTYNCNIIPLDKEFSGQNEEILVNCTKHLLHVLQTVQGDVIIDLGTDSPVWVTTRDYQFIEEKKGDKTSLKQGKKLLQVQYFVTPRLLDDEKEVKTPQATPEASPEAESGAEAEAVEAETIEF